MNYEGGFSGFGKGQYLQSIPKGVPVRYGSFAGGFNNSQAKQAGDPSTSPDVLDMEVTRKGRLRRMPGITIQETFAGRDVRQLIVHTDLNFTSELLMFDPPFIGVKREVGTVWTDVGLVDRPELYAWANYGGTLIFANGVGKVWTREPKKAPVESDKIPQGVDFFVFAGRLYVVGATIDGNYEPRGIAWSGADSYDDFDQIAQGEGFEVLIDDMSINDKIVAGKTLGLGMAVILMRRSIWVLSLSGDPFRPGDPQPRVAGIGAVNRACVQATRRGVVFLSDRGVEVFDGNQCIHISEPIDGDLLPLGDTTQFSSTYNPFTQQYQLHTPTKTWVFDLEKMRWLPWSLVARAGAIFAQQFHEVTWAEMVGDWTQQGLTIWKDLSPVEADVGEAWYLGLNGADPAIGNLDYASGQTFDGLLSPHWEFVPLDGEVLHEMLTVQGLNLEYSSTGQVRFKMPDEQGDETTVLVQTLDDAAAAVRDVWFGMMHSSKGAGLMVEILDGSVEIIRAELTVLKRGPRIQTTPATPGVYTP